MDRAGNKAARDLIAAAKIVMPSLAARVIDRAIQIHGADTPTERETTMRSRNPKKLTGGELLDMWGRD